VSANTHAIRVTVDGDSVRIDAPRGHLSDRDRDELRAGFDVIRPTLARMCSTPLPPRETWPDSWREAWEERVAIVRESNSIDADSEVIADADLRVMISRGLVEELAQRATSE
jgi:hypothetical protein